MQSYVLTYPRLEKLEHSGYPWALNRRLEGDGGGGGVIYVSKVPHRGHVHVVLHETNTSCLVKTEENTTINIDFGSGLLFIRKEFSVHERTSRLGGMESRRKYIQHP